jgi:putative pyruvate formate lyase activating enzyme
MSCCLETGVVATARGRPGATRQRARRAREALGNCHLCEHHCGVNRLAGKTGLCHADAEARFFCFHLDVAEDPELIPTFAIALSGCNLRCDFCITGASSWNAGVGAGFSPAEMARQATRALAEGARSVMLLGGEPTIHLPAALEFAAEMTSDATLVWKTNAYTSAEARELLQGVFDVWVADFKFGNDACALRLARVPDYVQAVRQNLVWAYENTTLIVRHLLMPGHLECCWKPVAEWLAARLPGVKVSLRDGFWPAWHAARHPELRGALSLNENRRARDIAAALGLNLLE